MAAEEKTQHVDPKMGEALCDDQSVAQLMQHPRMAEALAQLKKDPQSYHSLVSNDPELAEMFGKLRLMMEDTFQEEREAAGKWIRAQLTSAQLSTYFVGYLEHADLRREVEARWKGDFSLKKYHDKVLSFGSPPVAFARALLLDEPIPE